MKILHTADWHLGTFRSPVKDGVNLRSEDTKSCLDELIKAAEEEHPDFVLISGDVFDVGRLVSDRCCDEIITATQYIRELSAAAGQVVVMRGTPNHDGLGQFQVLNEIFYSCPNVHVVTTPQVLSFDKADIAVLPGFGSGVYRTKHPGLSQEEENAALSQELGNIVTGLKAQCSPGKTSILMAHYSVPGCNTESGQIMMPAQFEPVILPESLLAADYDLVALGHIHRPQQILSNNWFYAGAVNTMNFNDEGQERGFWIHCFKPDYVRSIFEYNTSVFYNTPVREFKTLFLDNEDISQFNAGAVDMVATYKWRGEIEDKIVRIHYRCSEENARALNTAVLEKELLDDGAFMVWETLPEKIEDPVNKTELSGTTDPEENLIRYLEEKQFPTDRVQELVMKARPVISEAEAKMPAAANTGIFEPVEISVENYRNYEKETFNFGGITFCTINDQNGAGKSSLFMDAVIDCLYEEPREGELTGWVRSDDNGCKGMIMFTFRIGEKTYRVTRTRSRPRLGSKMKTGEGKLNLAELVNGEWVNRSKERSADTQKEIINILGMDSFTFKSCALIMQDQYGLFLQAKPEERVEVLGTLLGLSIYPIMEKIVADNAQVNGAKNTDLKRKVEIHSNTISSLGNPDGELETCRLELAEYESRLQVMTEDREQKKRILENQQEAAERRDRLLTDIRTLEAKKAAREQSRENQQSIIDSSRVILDSRHEIEAKVEEYNIQTGKERTLAGESALYTAKKNEAENYRLLAEREQVSIDNIKAQIVQKVTELAALQPTDQDAVIRENAAEYERQKKLLEEAYEKDRSYRAVDQELTQKRFELQQLSAQYDADVKNIQMTEEGLKKKAELLSNVDCVDISNAKCGFLSDAVSAKQELDGYPERYARRKAGYEAQAAPINQQVAGLEKQLEEMDFDKGLIAAISAKAAELKPYAAQLAVLNQRESMTAMIQANLDNLQSNVSEAEKRLAEARLKGMEAAQERDRYAEAFKEHAAVQNAVLILKPWLEKEKQLAVAEERKTTAMGRVLELSAELVDIDTEMAVKKREADRESEAAEGIQELKGLVLKMDSDIYAINDAIRKKQIEFGALKQKTEQIAQLKREIGQLRERQAEYARETADFDILKAAFSQNGVPHQIIRSIIPKLTITSNTILGQMTGGKMGVEFRLEKIERGRKEKTTLDIFIEESGTTNA